MKNTQAHDIVDYWLADSVTSPEAAVARHDVWYSGGGEVDEGIRQRFGDCVEPALDGRLGAWADTAEGALALVILLDQFTRNLFRGTAQAYSGDALAHQVATRAVSTVPTIALEGA